MKICQPFNLFNVICMMGWNVSWMMMRMVTSGWWIPFQWFNRWRGRRHSCTIVIIVMMMAILVIVRMMWSCSRVHVRRRAVKHVMGMDQVISIGTVGVLDSMRPSNWGVDCFLPHNMDGNRDGFILHLRIFRWWRESHQFWFSYGWCPSIREDRLERNWKDSWRL